MALVIIIIALIMIEICIVGGIIILERFLERILAELKKQTDFMDI